jgi:hypothetical protein
MLDPISPVFQPRVARYALPWVSRRSWSLPWKRVFPYSKTDPQKIGKVSVKHNVIPFHGRDQNNTLCLTNTFLINKYEYHLPLYRQAKMFRDHFGVDLSRKTMGCWVEQAAELLKRVYRAIREDLLRGNYLQADENPIRYLEPDVKGKSQQG